MRRAITLITLMAVMVMPMTSALAANDHPEGSPWTQADDYGAQAGGKLGFGLKNVLLGWTELITEPVEQKSFWGVGQGLGNAVMDTVGGLLHVLTAPVTTIDVPLPENGTNLGQSGT